MKSNVKILNLLTIFLISTASVNSTEELEEANKRGLENAQQLEVPKNPLKNSGDFKGGLSKISTDELPHAATEMRFYRKMEGSTPTEHVTFEILDDLKNQIETADSTLKYFNKELQNRIKQEALDDSHIDTKKT